MFPKFNTWKAHGCSDMERKDTNEVYSPIQSENVVGGFGPSQTSDGNQSKTMRIESQTCVNSAK